MILFFIPLKSQKGVVIVVGCHAFSRIPQSLKPRPNYHSAGFFIYVSNFNHCMKTLELSEKNALSAYAKGSESERAFLKNLYPEYDFNVSIMDRVKTYEDACLDQNVKPLTIDDFSFLPEEDQEYAYYSHQYDIIHRALVQGWKSDKKNSKQNKYFPIFYWDENRAGGPGFSYGVDACTYSSSFVGARREFPTWELAKYSGTQFLSIHEKLHTL